MVLPIGLTIAGTLGGVFIGHRLARDTARRQWLVSELLELYSRAIAFVERYRSMKLGLISLREDLASLHAQGGKDGVSELGGRLDRLEKEADAMTEEFRWYRSRMKLLAPAEVRKAHPENLLDFVEDETVIDPFVDAARKHLTEVGGIKS